MSLGLGGFAFLRLKRRRLDLATILRQLPLLAACLTIMPAMFGQTVTVSPTTTPTSGVAGVNNVNINATGIPGTPSAANINVTYAASCGGPVLATVAANSYRNILGASRINVNIPTGLATGSYRVALTDTADPNPFTSTNCAQVQVTGSSAVLNACVAGSSLGVLLPPPSTTGNVTAYVPKGYWSSGTTGIITKNIEGATGNPSASISTSSVVNSCSSNPVTGKTVCVANNNDVFVLSGNAITNTLTSGSNTFASFSGGSCKNCGVALNANNNTAVINMGLTGPSNSGVQVLNLNTNTFSPPFPLSRLVSENISVDPTRSLILSASESGFYDLIQIQSDGVSLKEYKANFGIPSSPDSSAEDCSTGIALTPHEFSNAVTLVNLNAITFNTTTYDALRSTTTLVSSYTLSEGANGSAVAQGSGHLAVVTGEFGGDSFAVLKLPATASMVTPAIVDYAVAKIPSNALCGGTFRAGFDPHTITAYTSPNDGNSYAVFAGYSSGVPICLAVVNMTMVIDTVQAPRGGAGFQVHDVAPANLPTAAVKFFGL